MKVRLITSEDAAGVRQLLQSLSRRVAAKNNLPWPTAIYGWHELSYKEQCCWRAMASVLVAMDSVRLVTRNGDKTRKGIAVRVRHQQSKEPGSAPDGG